MPHSSKKYITPLDITISPSFVLKGLYFLLLIILLVACWFNGLSWITQLGLTFVVLLGCGYVFYNALLPRRQLRQLRLDRRGRWTLVFMNEQINAAVIKKSSAMLGGFFFLHFATTGGNRNIVLAPDNIDVDSARKLRVVLRVYQRALLGVEI